MTIKNDLSENSIYTHYILPAILKAGWNLQTQIREEVYFTDGRIYVNGNKTTRGKRKFADVILYYKPNIPVAIIEIKKNSLAVGAGMQQGLDYAAILDIPVVFSTNGNGFIEHDRSGHSTTVERELSLDNFPTVQEVWMKYQHYKNIKTPQAAYIAEFNYFYDVSGRTARYYQQIAINRSVEAIANGQDRLLLVMATGTGKTYTAFQIMYRLWKSGTKKRILFLADRNALVDQAKRGDFKHFKDKMTVIRHKEIDKAFEIYLALYQGLTNYDVDTDAYREFSPDFFDLIIVDECHRGSAADDSAWREILDYFKSASQLGLTATPKETTDVSNIDYFGQPLYTYSLKQGIEDGFLAPYKVIRLALNIDAEGWRPEKGKTDKQGILVDDRIYNVKDYDRLLVIDERTQLIARQIMTFLRQTNVYDKTIIFCTDIEHATRMRQAIVNEAQDLVLENYKYVMKITGDDIEGKRELDNFINPEERYPVIATTSKLMTTGVDAQTCKLIVLDANIGSMTEFKQIIGRGTRVNEAFGKQFFTIMDFRNVTDKFANKEFDGEPVMIKVIEGVNTDTETNFTDENTSINPTESQSNTNEDGITDNDLDHPSTTPVIISGGDIDEKTQTKIYVAGVEVKLLSERIQYLDDNGKLITGSLTDYTRSSLLKEFATLDNFLTRWNSIDKKKALIDEIEQQGIILEVLRNDVKKDLDIFDLICHIAWDKPALTRTERANNVKKRDYFTKYSNQAQEVIQALLDKYADVGIEHIENMSILSVDPFSAIGTPIEIIKLFGGKENYMAALKQLETEIYSIEA